MPKRENPAIITEAGIYYSTLKGKARTIPGETLRTLAMDNERMINAFALAYSCDAETAKNVILHYCYKDSLQACPDGLTAAEAQPWEQKEAEKPEKPARKRGKRNEEIQEAKRD